MAEQWREELIRQKKEIVNLKRVLCEIIFVAEKEMTPELWMKAESLLEGYIYEPAS